MMADTITMLPCPFCGGEAELLKVLDQHSVLVRNWIIQCENGCACAESDAFASDEVIATWNRRHPQGVTAPHDALESDRDVVTALRQRVAELEAREALSVSGGYWTASVTDNKPARRRGETTPRVLRINGTFLTEAEALKAAENAMDHGWVAEYMIHRETAKVHADFHLPSEEMKLIGRFLAAAPPAPSAWRPISVAPENEEVIVAASLRVATARRITRDGVGRWFFTDEECWTTAPPTHWMPLPAPPVAEKATEGAEGGR